MPVSSAAGAPLKVIFSNFPDEDGVEIEIIDRFGPLNKWEASSDYFPEGGAAVFTEDAIVGRRCGVVPCWEMHNAIWSKLRAGDTGPGVNNTENDRLEASSIFWKVISV